MIVYINGNKYECEANNTILDVCKAHNIFVPTLCHLKGIIEEANCRVCMVEVNGVLKPACATQVTENMQIVTDSKRVIDSRRTTLELIRSNHNNDCENCKKLLNCNLRKLSEMYNANIDKFEGKKTDCNIDSSSSCIIKDSSKCILCGRCVEVCKQLHGLDVFGKVNRGFNTVLECAAGDIASSECIGCGQCVLVCPTGALMEKDDLYDVRKSIENKQKHVVAIVAPSVRVALNEEFGGDMGTFDEGKLVNALKKCGFDNVYDVCNGADYTIIEEGDELIERLKNHHNLPLLTSCCPGWFNYVEKFHPELKPHVSSAKSPAEMTASLVKHFYKGEKELIIVSVMPCTAKKSELKRKGSAVDYSLTTREIARLIRSNGICYDELEDVCFDNPFSEYTGGAVIFGVTGGVMEAAVRYALHKLTGEHIKLVKEVQMENLAKVVSLSAGNTTLNLGIVSGLKQAEELIKSDLFKTLHFVEVMACPYGCNNGGGQPFVDRSIVTPKNIYTARGGALKARDTNLKNSNSSQNASANKILSTLSAHDRHNILHYKM